MIMSLTRNGEAPPLEQDQEPRSETNRRITLDIFSSSYLEACARIRGISTRALVIRLLDTIARDELAVSILDDQEEYKSRRKGEHKYRERV